MDNGMTVSENVQGAAQGEGAAQDGLPVGQLLAVTVAGFLAIMTENMQRRAGASVHKPR